MKEKDKKLKEEEFEVLTEEELEDAPAPDQRPKDPPGTKK